MNIVEFIMFFIILPSYFIYASFIEKKSPKKTGRAKVARDFFETRSRRMKRPPTRYDTALDERGALMLRMEKWVADYEATRKKMHFNPNPPDWLDLIAAYMFKHIKKALNKALYKCLFFMQETGVPRILDFYMKYKMEAIRGNYVPQGWPPFLEHDDTHYTYGFYKIRHTEYEKYQHMLHVVAMERNDALPFNAFIEEDFNAGSVTPTDSTERIRTPVYK